MDRYSKAWRRYEAQCKSDLHVHAQNTTIQDAPKRSPLQSLANNASKV